VPVFLKELKRLRVSHAISLRSGPQTGERLEMPLAALLRSERELFPSILKTLHTSVGTFFGTHGLGSLDFSHVLQLQPQNQPISAKC